MTRRRYYEYHPGNLDIVVEISKFVDGSITRSIRDTFQKYHDRHRQNITRAYRGHPENHRIYAGDTEETKTRKQDQAFDKSDNNYEQIEARD